MEMEEPMCLLEWVEKGWAKRLEMEVEGGLQDRMSGG